MLLTTKAKQKTLFTGPFAGIQVYLNGIEGFISPGQTESQVDASSKLDSTCDSVSQALRSLELTCDDLRSLWSRSNLHASRRKFFTVWQPNPGQGKLSDIH